MDQSAVDVVNPPHSATSQQLSSARGKLLLAFLCCVAFLDFADASIVNVTLPSIRTDLGFSVQNLQWVISAYVLTYGGFLLLGGRTSDLLGRRRMLVLGMSIFGLASVTAGFAPNSGVLVVSRLVQGFGAAAMTPAALSILTTSFDDRRERVRALGVWGSVSGGASVLGVFLGGVLAAGPGWRWIFFINPPVIVVLLIVSFRLLANDNKEVKLVDLDITGSVLITSAMVLGIYALVEAPAIGWGARTIGELAAAAVLIVAFVFNELRRREPLVDFRIFRIPGLALADVTQVVAMAGFISVFFFLTLYMQNVLHFSAARTGLAYVPAGVVLASSAALCSKLCSVLGTRPIIVSGALVAGGGIFWLSRVPVDGRYVVNLLPGLLIMGAGLGAVLVGVQTAANAGVPPRQAGLAAALVNTSFQLGSALGLAIFSDISTSHTNDLLRLHVGIAQAQTAGFSRALLASALSLAVAAALALRAINTREAADQV